MNRQILISLDKTLFQLMFYFILLISKLHRHRSLSYYPKFSGNESFLVIRPGGLGDGFMSIPMVRAMRNNFPSSKIILLCVKKNKLALEHLPYFDDIIVLDNLGSIHKNILKIFRNQIDVVLDLEPFRKISAVIAYLSGANIRIGFDTNNRRLLYTHYVTYANDKCYESVNMVRQLEVLGINVPQNEAVDIRFPLAEEFLEKGRTILKLHEINPEEELIISIVPGVLKAHHRWIMAKFASLINLILEEDNTVKILLLGSPSDIPDAQEVMQHTMKNERVINLVGKTNFMDVLGILNACKILIACDGGIVYMAASMGCNTISIWGPGVMERFKPPGNNNIGIRKDYFCIPCVNYSRLGEFPKCPYDRKCIKDISATDVFEKYVHMKNLVLVEDKRLSLDKVI